MCTSEPSVVNLSATEMKAWGHPALRSVLPSSLHRKHNVKLSLSFAGPRAGPAQRCTSSYTMANPQGTINFYGVPKMKTGLYCACWEAIFAVNHLRLKRQVKGGQTQHNEVSLSRLVR